jgi:hypothetical protein
MADKKKKAAAPVDEKAAKRKARMEALKNRPAEQRPNSKQIDIIATENGGCVKNFGYPLKANGKHIGVLVTSVAYDAEGNVLSSNTTLVPGDHTVKAKKGHGTIVAAKYKTEEQKAKKKSKKAAKEEEEDED